MENNYDNKQNKTTINKFSIPEMFSDLSNRKQK